MAFQIRKTEFQPTPKRKAQKSKNYLSFIHRLPCVVTGRTAVEAAHLSSAAPQYGHYGRAKGTKVSDRWVLPLAPEEHRAQHAGNEMAYWQSVGINPHMLALTIYGLFSEMGDDAEPFASAIINQQLAVNGRLPSREVG
jgi:hypothetical protein